MLYAWCAARTFTLYLDKTLHKLLNENQKRQDSRYVAQVP